ncbi:hypothetical protein COCCADRAFT_106952 [Bipolaris zeicola 26-R-13]|uniref:Uncharacterized protein n=1 Tax=Cochliobolus carbonum (strain 26-R-13) TaxID=930089 RepID=W6XPL5_COCC2|nr:uncharacterized protein COCCADRAFT_106952 [Bipolaris zeicola 26-R-13]EUC29282.1 hypothetical protein COCCADRAFT_106952 [Bipolaris zeicola 26-R-13]
MRALLQTILSSDSPKECLSALFVPERGTFSSFSRKRKRGVSLRKHVAFIEDAASQAATTGDKYGASCPTTFPHFQ